jgi:hypothetical protein
MAQTYNLDVADLPALAEKMEDWEGCVGGVDRKGLYALARYNEHAKWDWYTVGGRWRGLLKLKSGAEGEFGERWMEKVTGEVREELPGRADTALRGDIDFDGMRDAAEAEARETWRLYAAAIAGTPAHAPWSDFRARVQKGDLPIDEARLAYGEQLRVKAFRAATELMERVGFLGSPDDFPETEEAFVARQRGEATTTFAYVMHGEWHERGDMGWWGIVVNETEPDAWVTEFNAMLESLPEDETLTVVDCHI